MNGRKQLVILAHLAGIFERDSDGDRDLGAILEPEIGLRPRLNAPLTSELAQRRLTWEGKPYLVVE